MILGGYCVMVSKMQLRTIGEMCPGYVLASTSWTLSMAEQKELESCETCIHWENNKCNINLFDKVLAGLDQT